MIGYIFGITLMLAVCIAFVVYLMFYLKVVYDEDRLGILTAGAFISLLLSAAWPITALPTLIGGIVFIVLSKRAKH